MRRAGRRPSPGSASPTRSTSSRMCDEKRIVRPAAAIWPSSSIIARRWRGSMPLNGSSSSSTCGSCTSAPATLARCRMPLEYVPIGRFSASSRSTARIAARAAASAVRQPWRLRVEADVLEARQERIDRLSFRHEPDLAVDRRIAGWGCGPGHGPCRRTARGSPASMCRSVVLPAPFGPSRPVTPAPEAEAQVVDGDDVAVPASGVDELDCGSAGRYCATGAGAGARRAGAGAAAGAWAAAASGTAASGHWPDDRCGSWSCRDPAVAEEQHAGEDDARSRGRRARTRRHRASPERHLRRSRDRAMPLRRTSAVAAGEHVGRPSAASSLSAHDQSAVLPIE